MSDPSAVGQWVCDTAGGGTQDLSVTGVTDTIKAGILLVFRATTVGTAAAEAVMSMGFFGGDGVGGINAFACGCTEQDADVAGTDASTASKDGSVIYMLDPGEITVDGEATVSVGAGKITLTWTTYPSSAWIIIGKFFYGGNVTSSCGAATPTATGLHAVTTVGFKHHIAFHMCASVAADGSDATQNRFTFGVSTVDHSDDSVSQWVSNYQSANGSPTATQTQFPSGQVAIGQNAARTGFFQADVQNPDAQGWDYNITITAPNVQIMYLAINLGIVGKADCGIDTITKFSRDQYFPINFTYDTVGLPSRSRGYRPGAFGMCLSKNTTTGTETGNEMRCFGFTDGTNEYAGAIVAEDNVTTSNTISVVHNLLAFNADPDGTTLDEVQLDSFTQDGLIYNNSKDSFLEYYYGYWAIKQYGETIPANSLLYDTQQDASTDKIEWKLNTAPTKATYYDVLTDGTLYYSADTTFTTGTDSITLDVYRNNASSPETLTTTINAAAASSTNTTSFSRRSRRW